MLALTLLSACGDGGPSGLSPTLTERAPTKNELSALAGRWEPVTSREGAAVHCEGEAPAGDTAFVEIRGDGEGGWEVVSQVGADLLILPVRKTKHLEDGLELELASVTPGEPNQTLKVTWTEPQRLAVFGPPLDGRLYVAPAHAASIPTVPCPADEGQAPSE